MDWRISCDPHKALQDPCHFSGCQPVISVPPSLLHAHQARCHHLREVPTANLRRDIPCPGQFRGGEQASIYQLQYPEKRCHSVVL